MQIEIRLIEKRLQLTKFQIFKRTSLGFNGAVMSQGQAFTSGYPKTAILRIGVRECMLHNLRVK
jgi:hypothetical protein